MLCSVLLCSVMFCSVVFCCVLLCSVVFCCVLLCSVMFCYVLFCSVMFCYVRLCSVMFGSVMFCSVMLCYVTLRYATLRYVTLCYVMSAVSCFTLCYLCIENLHYHRRQAWTRLNNHLRGPYPYNSYPRFRTPADWYLDKRKQLYFVCHLSRVSKREVII